MWPQRIFGTYPGLDSFGISFPIFCKAFTNASSCFDPFVLCFLFIFFSFCFDPFVVVVVLFLFLFFFFFFRGIPLRWQNEHAYMNSDYKSGSFLQIRDNYSKVNIS